VPSIAPTIIEDSRNDNLSDNDTDDGVALCCNVKMTKFDSSSSQIEQIVEDIEPSIHGNHSHSVA
jgi:hypothetical protein